MHPCHLIVLLQLQWWSEKISITYRLVAVKHACSDGVQKISISLSYLVASAVVECKKYQYPYRLVAAAVVECTKISITPSSCCPMQWWSAKNIHNPIVLLQLQWWSAEKYA